MQLRKLLLTYYSNISVQAANLSQCRIESNRKNRFGSEDRIETFFARIGMLYTAGTCGSPIVVVTMATIQSTCSRRHVTSQARTPVTTTARGHLPRLDTAHRQSYTRHYTQLSARGAHRIFFPGEGHRRRNGSAVGGHHGECGARAYNGGLGAEPPAGSRGRASGPGVKRAKPPEAASILDIGCPTDSLNNNCIYISTLRSVI